MNVLFPRSLAVSLHYLVFDYSEDASGHGSFDAMASASAAQRPALEAEIAAVLGWAHGEFPAGRRPLDEGGDWDYSLHGVLEVAQALSADYEPGTGTLSLRAEPPGPPRTTFDLALTGTADFCAAFRSAFDIDQGT